MSKKYKQGDYLVLRHKTIDRLIVVGLLAEDFEDSLGASALFKMDMVAGLPVDSATFNANMWSILGEAGINKKASEMEYALVRCMYDLLFKLNKEF